MAALTEKQREDGRRRCREWYARNAVAQRARVQRYVDKYPEKAKAAVTKFSHSPHGRYLTHKSGTKKRGIGWEFTFETWWKMWEPYWEQRGNDTPESLVMARYNDEGPYSPTYVRIATRTENFDELRQTLARRRKRALR